MNCTDRNLLLHKERFFLVLKYDKFSQLNQVSLYTSITRTKQIAQPHPPFSEQAAGVPAAAARKG